MENTSKILIIVGAILIAIFIVGIGMYIYQNSNMNKLTNGTISQMDIEQFNIKYEMYEGKQKGSIVKKLLDLALKNNEPLYKEEKNIQYCVGIRSNDKTLIDSFKGNNPMITALNGSRWYGVIYPSNIKQISNKILNSKIYNIWFGYNEYGYIWEINIDTV